MSINELKKLTRANLPLVTVLAGEDVGLYRQMKDNLLKQIGFDASDLTSAYYDLSVTPYTEVAMDLESLPFFAEEKIVILDYLQDLTTDKKTYLEEQESKSLETYLENPLDTNRLIIFAAGKLDGKRRLVKRLKRDALILDASPLKEKEFKNYFLQEAQSKGLIFESGAFDHLLYKAQFDFGQMSQNIAFLSDYHQSSSAISQKEIDEAIPKTLQDNLFDLTQLTLQGKVEEALDLVRDLRLQGEEEIKLIAVMLGQVRLFTQLRLLAQQGRNEQQITAELSDSLGRKVNPYQVKYGLRDSQSYAVKKLQLTLKILIETDYHIKIGTYDKAYLFELALLKIAGIK